MGAAREVSGLGDVMAVGRDGITECWRCDGGRSCVNAGEANGGLTRIEETCSNIDK